METEIANAVPVTIVDSVAERSLSGLEQWQQFRAGALPEQVVEDHIRAWVADDSKAMHALDGEAARSAAATIAHNAVHCQPYADFLRENDARLADKIRPEIELTTATRFFSGVANLLPEKVVERVQNAGPTLRALLGDLPRMLALEERLAARLDWIGPSRIADVHAAVAAAMGRDDAAERARTAALLRSPHSQEATSNTAVARNTDDAHAQQVADFIAANKGLLSWKIRANVQEAPEQLKGILRDSVRMRHLDPVVRAKLSGISPAFIADVHAIVAAELDRPDSASRSELAANIHKGEPAHSSAQEATEPALVRADSESLATEWGNRPSPAPSRAASIDGTEEDTRGNGFAPGDDLERPAPIEQVGDLLERITFKSMRDGTVVYSLDEHPAFVDHGDHLLMAHRSEANEQAILAAILLANEKYRGSMEITGTPQFIHLAVEVIVKYGIDTRLKDPEQDALRRTMRLPNVTMFPRASTEHPVSPVSLKTPESHHTGPPVQPAAGGQQKAPNGSDSSTAIEGEVINFGSAPYQNKSGNALSFFVTLRDESGHDRTMWGVDLARAVKSAAVQPGDRISLKKHAKVPAEVSRPAFDSKGEFTGTTTVISNKILWALHITEKGPRSSTANQRDEDRREPRPSEQVRQKKVPLREPGRTPVRARDVGTPRMPRSRRQAASS